MSARVSVGGNCGECCTRCNSADAEKLVVVSDSEYVYTGVMEWLVKWRQHGWQCLTWEVGHGDLWEAIVWLRGSGAGWGGGDVQLRWVLSHLSVNGNDEAHAWASLGRHLHPKNLLPLSKKPRVTEWDNLGLEPMAESEQLSDPDTGDDSAAGLRTMRARDRRPQQSRSVMVLPWMSVTGHGRGHKSSVHWRCGRPTTVRMSVTPSAGTAGG